MKKSLSALVLFGAGFLASCTTNIIVNNKSSDSVTVTLDGSQSQTITSGSSYTYSSVPASFLDPSPTIKATGSYIDEQSQKLSLTPGKDTTVDVTNTRTYLKIVNSSAVMSIWYIYISPSTNGTWGTNWLPGTVSTGSSVYYQVTPGKYDIWVKYSDGYNTYSYSNTVAALSTVVKTASWISNTFSPQLDSRPAPVFEAKAL